MEQAASQNRIEAFADSMLRSPVARTDDDRQRFADERRRVEGPDADDARDERDTDGPSEDSVREEQRRSADEPDEPG